MGTDDDDWRVALSKLELPRISGVDADVLAQISTAISLKRIADVLEKNPKKVIAAISKISDALTSQMHVMTVNGD